MRCWGAATQTATVLFLLFDAVAQATLYQRLSQRPIARHHQIDEFHGQGGRVGKESAQQPDILEVELHEYLGDKDDYLISRFPEECGKELGTYPISPPIPNDTARDLQLLQVHVIARHGHRTPAIEEICWPRYHPLFNCSYSASLRRALLAAVPQAPLVLRTNADGTKTTLGYLNEFSAERFPRIAESVECFEKQLLPSGVEQQIILGELLSQAYLQTKNPYKLPRPNSPPLLNLSDPRSLHSDVYFRATDKQRTVLSAYGLIAGLLGHNTTSNGLMPRLTIHVQPITADPLYADVHPVTSPELYDMVFSVARAISPGLNLKHNRTIRQMEALGYDHNWKDGFPFRLHDCFLANYCEETFWKNLPSDVRPYGFTANNSAPQHCHHANHSKALRPAEQFLQNVQALLADSNKRFQLYNNSQFAKASSKGFVAEIQERIERAVSGVYSPEGNPKFILYSSHDTTVNSFLATFGERTFDGQWPPYASAVLLELYGIRQGSASNMRHRLLVDSKDYKFRLLYNGRDLTQTITGCESLRSGSPCEYGALKRALAWVWM